MEKKKLFFIFGTRPESIKTAPLIIAAKQDQNFETKVCITAQHRQMLDQVLVFFNIRPDYDLDLMRHNQDLFDITNSGLIKLKTVLNEVKPDLILVQGDTATAFVGAIAGFYSKIPVAHIEAGLRSHDKYSPYPEEMYRLLIGQLATYHFAPTKLSKANLKRENITSNVHVVGNTAIDALFLGLSMIKQANEGIYYDHFNFLDFNKKIVLVTSHRRENFGDPLKNICIAVKSLAEKYHNVQFVYPLHPNPNVQDIARSLLTGTKNIFLIKPLEYNYMIWLIAKSYIIITDSGGLQEEAPSLGKPVLVTRDVTERIEGIKAGNAKLVGTNASVIISETEKLFGDQNLYNTMSMTNNPYGNGNACKYILKYIRKS